MAVLGIRKTHAAADVFGECAEQAVACGNPPIIRIVNHAVDDALTGIAQILERCAEQLMGAAVVVLYKGPKEIALYAVAQLAEKLIHAIRRADGFFDTVKRNIRIIADIFCQYFRIAAVGMEGNAVEGLARFFIRQQRIDEDIDHVIIVVIRPDTGSNIMLRELAAKRDHYILGKTPGEARRGRLAAAVREIRGFGLVLYGDRVDADAALFKFLYSFAQISGIYVGIFAEENAA